MNSRAFLIMVALILLAALASTAVAQADVRIVFEPSGATDETAQVDDADFPLLRLTLTPMTDAGVPVGGLSPDDFAVQEGGVPIDDFTITERIDPNQGISVVLVLDVSGSMRDDIDALRAATATLYDQVLQQSDESAIVTFAATADGAGVNLSDPFPQLTAGREAGYTNDEGMLKNLINSLIVNEGDGTPLYDAIYKGARMAREEAANSRSIVIVMTDGVDESRAGVAEEGSVIYDREGLIDELRALNVPIFTVGLGDEIDSAFLQRVANTTGGVYQNAPTGEALSGIFTELAGQLKVKYDLAFQSRVLSDGALHSVNVSAQTPAGVVEGAAQFEAMYPLTPWIQDVQAANPRQEPRPLTSFESVKGRVTVWPTIVARGDLAAVEYYVDDQLVYTAEATPWEFAWDTSDLPPDEARRLSIVARDDATPANVGRTDFDLLVEECTVICLFEQQTGLVINPTYGLIGLGVLLLLFALLLWWLLRRRHEPEPVYQTPVYTPPPLVDIPSTPPVTVKPTVADFAPASRPRPKTEVLNRAPGPIAFLIDTETGRQFALRDGTAIGSGADNDVIFDDSAVSGRHARLKLEDGQFALFDLASTNGTEVNGMAITRHVLTDNDRVKIGRKTLTFKRVG